MVVYYYSFDYRLNIGKHKVYSKNVINIFLISCKFYNVYLSMSLYTKVIFQRAEPNLFYIFYKLINPLSNNSVIIIEIKS